MPRIERGEAFRRWFGDSKVVDDDGAPLVLYHGSIHWEERERQIGNIRVFDRLASHAIVGRPLGADCAGVWLSSEAGADGAAFYAGNEGVIYPLFARIRHPWRPKTFEDFLIRFHRAAGRDPKRENPPGCGCPQPLRDWLVRRGYDGIHFPRQRHEAPARALADAREKLDSAEAEEEATYRAWESGSASRATRDAARQARVAASEALILAQKTNRKFTAEGTEFVKQDVWVVLEPHQLKSAIGNRGTFSLDDPDITH